MSQVYAATEIALGRRVVIKVLPPGVGVSLSAGRFRQETRLAANCRHPTIVPVLTAGSAGELLYYTMPLVQSGASRCATGWRATLGGTSLAFAPQTLISNRARALPVGSTCASRAPAPPQASSA